MKRNKALESIAYHEAGHAVVAWRVGVEAKSLSIISEPGSKGRYIHKPYFTDITPEYDTSPRAERRLKNMVLVCFAGEIAQRRFNSGEWRDYHGERDFDQAVDLLNYLAGSEDDLQAHINAIHLQAQQMVEDPSVWLCIGALAAALLEHGELSGTETVRIIRDAWKRD